MKFKAWLWGVSFAVTTVTLPNMANASKWAEFLNQTAVALQQINEVAQQAQRSGASQVPEQRYSAPQQNQFTTNADGAIQSVAVAADQAQLSRGYFVDTATGLTWYRCPAPSVWNGRACTGTVYMPQNYMEVLKIVKDANAQRYGGYSDWRLPTLNELLLTTYGTAHMGQNLVKYQVRGVDIWRNKMLTASHVVDGECGLTCVWGNPWTSTNKVTGSGQEFAFLNLSRSGLTGQIYAPNETVQVGSGVEYATYERGVSARQAVVRLVRGGQGTADSGYGAVQQYKAAESAKNRANIAAYEQAQAVTKACKDEKNAAWRKNIQVGDMTNRGGVVQVVGGLIVVNDKNGQFIRYTPAQLENFMINTLCAEEEYKIIQNF